MKERAAYRAASAGQQSVESNGPTVQPPFEALVENEKPRAKSKTTPVGLTFPRYRAEAVVRLTFAAPRTPIECQVCADSG